MSHIKQQAFTILELLIVIVVIAILAAIGTVAYTGIQSRAKQSVVEADLINMDKILRAYYVEHEETPRELDDVKGNLGSLANRIVWAEFYDPGFIISTTTQRGEYYVWTWSNPEYHSTMYYWDYKDQLWRYVSRAPRGDEAGNATHGESAVCTTVTLEECGQQGEY